MIEIGLRYGCDMVEILDMAEIFLMYSPESDLFEEIGPILVT